MTEPRKRSLREHLLALTKQHPDWDAHTLAQHLGQHPATIRATLSIFRRKGLITHRAPRKAAQPQGARRKPKKGALESYRKYKAPSRQKLLERPQFTIASSANSRRYGYLQLL